MISKNNIKYIQSLHLKKNRDEERIFIVEGPKMVNELLQSGLQVEQIYAVDGNWLQTDGVNSNAQVISSDALKQISGLRTPNQVIALAKQKPQREPDDKLMIMLDGIQDPGNLGTIIRIADWFGIQHIIASGDTADEYNPKVIQATMGSIFRINIMYTDLEDFLRANTLKIYAAMLHGNDITQHPKIAEGIILIGNESKGIRENLQRFIAEKITIPSRGKAESLNASVALGIILSHMI